MSWYEQLALGLGKPGHGSREPLEQGTEPLVKIDLDRGTTADHARSRSAIWLGELLDHMIEHLDDLVAPTMRVAENRRQPWWR